MGIAGKIATWFDRFTGAERRTKRRLVNAMAEQNFTRAARVAEKINADPPDESLRRWESSKTTRLNQGHWAGVTGQPVNADLAGRLNDLRMRSEFEVANNPLVEGMIATYQLSVVGSEGPRLSVLTSDEAYALKRAQIWNTWAQTAGSNQQLSLVELLDQWIRDLFACGEFFCQMVSVPDAPGPVKMRLLPIHTHRLATDPRYLGDPEVALGVRRDLANRRPKSYYVSQPYIMGPWEVYTGKFLEIPYADALHGFRMLEEDQVRGVPWLASCLDAIGELRDFKTETLDAARAAADFCVFLSAANNPDIPGMTVNETTDIQRRTVRSVPPGWTPNMVAPAHPGPQYDTFYESLAREIGGPVCMPLMMLLLDSSSHNYSSARFDGQMFWRGVAKTQGWLGRLLLRVESIVALEAELAGELPPPPDDLSVSLNWTRAPHVDPVKEANAERAELENGGLTYQAYCASRNQTTEQNIASRKRSNEMLVAAGLTPILGIPSNSGGGGAPAEPDDDDKKPAENRAEKAMKRNGHARMNFN
jgi:capsid protein